MKNTMSLPLLMTFSGIERLIALSAKGREAVLTSMAEGLNFEEMYARITILKRRAIADRDTLKQGDLKALEVELQMLHLSLQKTAQ